MIEPDVKKVEEIIRHIASDIVMPRFNTLKASDIREKGPGDFVTIADEESEEEFGRLLPQLLPGSVVVGEEAVAKDKGVIERLKGEEPVWVIDPIDGTYNFSHGVSKFGILLSLVQKGETLYGWAFDAPGNRMAAAALGAGTFLDGARVNIDCAKTEMGALIGSGDRYPPSAGLKEVTDQRCSLHDCMDFITGDIDFVVTRTSITPWDQGATSLIAAEAGGYVAMNDVETRYDPTLLGPAFLLIAPDRAWWEKLYPHLYPHIRKGKAS